MNTFRLLQYRIFFWAISPLLALISIKHYRQYKDKIYLWQRTGFKLPDIHQPVWIHCASVGEVLTASVFIQRLHQRTRQPILLTTNTITAAALAKKNLPFVTHCYLPLDFSVCVKRFINKLRPQQAIIVETEIWPVLFEQLHKNNIPISIINARLSKKTSDANRLMQKLYRQTLAHVDKIYCRSDEHKTAYSKLGAEEQQLKTIGNLKYAFSSQQSVQNKNLIGREYVLAASTHAHEEKIIYNSWQKLSAEKPLLVIAPRHPDRRNDIIKDLGLEPNRIAIRSQGDQITNETIVYLADTIGEMQHLFGYAKLVIMAGSFTNIGGHNIIEPARAGKAIVYGPYMDNFSEENTLFLQNRASIQVSDPDALTILLTELLPDTQRLKDIGENAYKLVTQFDAMAENYLDELGF
jgi:3-deoxy-D-manno-octulosonic-acid transferase